MVTFPSFTPTVIFFIALGGSIGAVCRFAITYLARQSYSGDFPVGVLIANAIGTLLAGFVYTLLQQKILLWGYWSPLLMVGFLGALTTFSTFSLDALWMLQQGEYFRASVYLALSVGICLVFAWLGMQLGMMLD